MYGYMIYHERQINRQAKAIKALAGEYLRVVEEARAISKMPNWVSPAADKQRELIKGILTEAEATAAALKQIGNDLYWFTESHKTWLEEIVDIIS